MQPTATDGVARSVSQSVCLSVHHVHELCKYGRTDAVWGADSCGS